MILNNIRYIFQNRKYLIAYSIMVGILGVLWWQFTDITLAWWNYGAIRTSIDIAISFINIFGFPLFIVAWIYRSHTLGTYTSHSERAGFVGGTLGVIISGSICCGTSLLIPLGASAFIDILSKYFPYGGLELKILGVGVLLFGLHRLLSNLTACQMSRPKK